MTKLHKILVQYKQSWKSLVFLLLLCTVSLVVNRESVTQFKASVISFQKPAVFDGTSLPVLAVPKWTSLTSNEWKKQYYQIPPEKFIPLPLYDTAMLQIPLNQVGLSTEKDLLIRNAKRTYSTVNLGNYKFDHVENAGSHTGVDIALPEGTPVHSIGNGIVVKAVSQTTGFGRHIVVMHEDFPSMSNPSVKVKIYSGYGHLSELLVKEGQVVTKGQVIGKSGNTGNSTGPHLHFQIDTNEAPWHPYWPFTYKESQAAGLDFFGSVNAGLGKEKGMMLTIHPMFYVQKYLDPSQISGSSWVQNSSIQLPQPQPPLSSPPQSSGSFSTVPDDLPPVLHPAASEVFSEPQPQPQPQSQPQPQPQPQPPVIELPPVRVDASSFRITYDETFISGLEESLLIMAVDSKGNPVTSYKPAKNLSIHILLGKIDVLSEIGDDDFVQGQAVLKIVPRSNADFQIEVTDGSITGKTGIVMSEVFSDVESTARYYKSIKFLKKYQIVQGYSDHTFRPNSKISRSEVAKLLAEALQWEVYSVTKLPFKDTVPSAWYGSFIAAAVERNIIRGYADKTFKPENPVTRAELHQMISMAMGGYFLDDNESYRDVPDETWFSLSAKDAKARNLTVKAGRIFEPHEEVTREEVAEVLYRLIMLKISGKVAYTSDIHVAGSQLQQYFN